MRYDDQDRESSNVEDRRGQGGGGMFRIPGGFGRGRGGGRRVRIPFPMGRGGGRGGFSITTLIIIGVVMWFLGFNPLKLLTGGGPGGGGLPDVSQMPQLPKFDQPNREARRSGGGVQIPTSRNAPANRPARPDDQLVTFTKRVLADTEDVWNRVFKSFGRQYKEPKLVVFSGTTRTACGLGQSAMGPFYCPLDQKVYIDMRFYQELHRKFRAPGDFAQAYVIAHEVGHHVQKLLGIADKVLQLKQRYPSSANKIQVRMELQADCLSGVWANLNDQLHNRLEPGDIEEGLNAANAIGDDMIQKRQQGYVVPDAFTHGTAAQRVRWFSKGYKSGRMDVCDTFNASEL
ncbi:MAG: KPN_02809 family neutral zinc metallopeptidase [Hyphomicrobiaceae bacterium]